MEQSVAPWSKDDRMDLDGTRNNEEQGSDEEEGNDMSTDSSEEEEDDPEEARKIQEGFILVEEATGHRPERASKSRLKRLRRARDDTELDEELADLQDVTGDYRKATGDQTRLHDLWDDDSTLRVQRRNEELDEDDGMFEDDMRGFIEADEDEEENEMGEAERQERLERRRAEKERRRTAGGISELAGLDKNAIDMLLEVFGDGHDYDWALGDETDEVGEVKKDTKYTDVSLSQVDIPERMQLVTSSLTTDATLSLEPPLQPQDLNDAAYWVSLRLGQRIERDFFKEDGQFRRYLPMLITAVQVTLDHLFIQNLEVPYIAAHKKDYIWHIDGANHIELLSVAELWRVYSLGQKFRAFQERKKALEGMHSKLSAPDDYYKSDIQPKLDSMEAITDATEWLSMQHRLELQDASMIEEDGKTKRPTRVSTYEMLKKSPIDHLVKDFCPPAREISRKVREVMQSRGSAVHRFLDDPVLPPLEHVIPYVDAEKQRLMEIERKRWATNPMAQNESSLVREVTSETMLERARLLIATELGKDPLLRQVVRTMFTNSAEMSCSPTDKGLIKVDETHPYYPLRLMTKSSQFLHIMSAEAEHLVTVQVGIPEETRRQFVDDLRQAVSSDGYSDASRLWNEVRAQAVTEAVDKHFIPYGAKWIREWLREEVEDWVARKCGDELEQVRSS
ncbi:14559_t:CDS:2 [Acaulospora colombiana]|uniref:14559_t:CDS:1 n=1 Tax=Acaulospora colombiana TaxID=27376 RepID=A0ACA9N6L1_9GLOM|nr:14559_t:CDS:2 [Acaulospora colombiana]